MAELPSRTSGPWPAPPKLNLFLHVTGRRPDGYHELQTVFQFLDYQDDLYFSVSSGRAIRRVSGPEAVPEAEDLSVRAARLLQQRAGIDRGVEISIVKRLPLGGGIGGGSSDAATTLVALNHLWKAGLSIPQLAGLGLELGADVPVFVGCHAAWAEGVGERLTPVSLPEPWFLVVFPPVSVSTSEVFSDPELTRNTPHITISDFLSGCGGNDCEAVVRHRYPVVAEVMDWLNSFAPARLTGTGSGVFAIFPDKEAARQVLDRLPDTWSGLVARGLNCSPLEGVLSVHAGACAP